MGYYRQRQEAIPLNPEKSIIFQMSGKNSRKETLNLMGVTMRTIVLAGVMAGCMAMPCVAAKSAKILVDKVEIDVGALPEGKTKVIEQVFIVKNTGDTILHITKVKPG
jgi:hypothetical protein